MKKYEVTFLISPEVEKTEDVIKNLKANLPGEVIETEEPEEISLSYSIQEKDRALLGVISFEGDPQKVREFKDFLEKKKEILRFLLIEKLEKKVKKKRGKAPISKENSSEESFKKESPREKKKVDMDKIEEKIGEISNKEE